MKSNNKTFEKNNANIITLFKILWNPEQMTGEFDDLIKNSGLTDKQIVELQKSQKNIQKLETKLVSSGKSKKAKKQNTFKKSVDNKAVVRSVDKKQPNNKMNENEQERE